MDPPNFQRDAGVRPLLDSTLGIAMLEGTVRSWDAADGWTEPRTGSDRMSETNRRFFSDSDHLGVEHA